jgi:multidrug efflux pump subunit AcrA (membrane-fusion protein)
MTFAVAEVKNPFKADPTDERPPLSIGLFVEADIGGKVIENALRLPKDSVYRGREILVLNDRDQVYFQPVSIVRSDSMSVVAVGIPAGTKIVTTRISLPINGMKVEPQLEREPQLNQEPQQTQQSAGDAS